MSNMKYRDTLSLDNTNRLSPNLTTEKAWKLLTLYNKLPFIYFMPKLNCRSCDALLCSFIGL